MPRPTTKAGLLEAAYKSYSKLNEIISSLTEEQLSTPFDFSGNGQKKEAHWRRDKNLRDILIHPRNCSQRGNSSGRAIRLWVLTLFPTLQATTTGRLKS